MTEPEPIMPAAGSAAGLPPLGPTATSPLQGPATTSPPPQASELIGLDGLATRVLRAAAERVEQPPTIVWQYKTAACALDLFLYFDLRSGRTRTLHYAFKGDAANTARRQDCLGSLVATRSG